MPVFRHRICPRLIAKSCAVCALRRSRFFSNHCSLQRCGPCASHTPRWHNNQKDPRNRAPQLHNLRTALFARKIYSHFEILASPTRAFNASKSETWLNRNWSPDKRHALRSYFQHNTREVRTHKLLERRPSKRRQTKTPKHTHTNHNPKDHNNLLCCKAILCCARFCCSVEILRKQFHKRIRRNPYPFTQLRSG